MNPPFNGAVSTDRIVAPWPIIPLADVSISPAQGRRLDRLTAEALAADPALRSEWFLQHDVAPGWSPGPTIYLEDHRGIELASEALSQPFEYRSLALAGSGDFYLVSEPRQPEFEAYLREYVGLGAPVILAARTKDVVETRRLGKACLRRSEIMNALAETAVDHGGVNIAPFLSTGDIWSLGHEVARRSARPVRIAAPPPHLAACANNKLWFARFVRRLIGRQAIPATYEAYGLTAAVAKIKSLARKTTQIVVKVPASAGAVGNLVLPSALFKDRPIADIHTVLKENLRAVNWPSRYPLLLGEWEQDVIASPSVQIWVPLREQAPPIIEGVFTQVMSTEAGRFVGAERADLPSLLMGRMLSEAQLIASALQRLGYYGRLSLDTVLVGEGLDAADIHWIEANARWGGVSIPMTVANKLAGGSSEPDLFIVQKALERTIPMTTEELLDKIESELASLPAGRRCGVVLLLPLESRHLLFAVIGLPMAEARARAEKVAAACAL